MFLINKCNDTGIGHMLYFINLSYFIKCWIYTMPFINWLRFDLLLEIEIYECQRIYLICAGKVQIFEKSGMYESNLR